MSRPASAQASATHAPPPPEDDAIATRLLAGRRPPMPTNAAAISTISSRSLLSITPYFANSARYSASLPFAAVCAAIARAPASEAPSRLTISGTPARSALAAARSNVAMFLMSSISISTAAVLPSSTTNSAKSLAVRHASLPVVMM